MSCSELAALDGGAISETSESKKHMWPLWKLIFMPKVRVFWWRVLRDILRVESILKHRHIASIGRCKICLDADEVLMHALIKWEHGRKFWEEA
jgi:hypothetical protein